MPKEKSPKRPGSDTGSSLSEAGAKITHYIQAGYPGLYLVSPEEQRVEAELKHILDCFNQSRTQTERYQLCYWSVADGLVNPQTGQVHQATDPLDILQAIADHADRAVFLLKDYHLFLQDPNPLVLRKLKDVLLEGKTKQKTVIILGCRLVLPPELERELVVLELALPDKDALRHVLQGILQSARLENMEACQQEKVIAAASGLTTIEAENAFALSFVQARAIEPAIVAREKAQAVKKSGLLEIIEPTESLDDIGGLDQLKGWLLTRKDAFSERARRYGLPLPKGLLILGLPGTGKSLTAKATARVFGVPLLRLDAGRLFASLVGQSEGNLRSALQTAEAIAPAILWLDEIEKGFAGTKSSGASDGGTSARVFGTFLNWMQDKTASVFVVATANDVSQLPPELLRKGRFDELFFVDLPTAEERQAIWTLQIARHHREWRDFDIPALAKATETFTGAEIETAFIEAMYRAFEREAEPTDLDIAQVLTDFTPLAKLMAEPIAVLRQWAKGRARPATTPPPDSKLRKLAV